LSLFAHAMRHEFVGMNEIKDRAVRGWQQ